jgi:hypothetical protein
MIIWSIAFVLAFLWYLNLMAVRLDRLHHRVETSWANLDASLQKRAALALEIAHLHALDPVTNFVLISAAKQAREADFKERSAAESALSSALSFVEDAREFPPGSEEIFSELVSINDRLRTAVALHIEAVQSTRNRRNRLIYRILPLAGTAPLPMQYDFEEAFLR